MMKLILRFFTLFTLSLLTWGASAVTDTIEIKKQPSISVANVPFFEGDNLTFNEFVKLLSKKGFLKQISEVKENKNRQVVWLHFFLKNKGEAKTLLMEFRNWSYVELYPVPTKTNGFKKTGQLVPFEERSYKLGNKNLIPIKLGDKELAECFLRLTYSPITIHSPDFTFKVSTENYQLKEENDNRYILGILWGIFLILILYNSFIYISTKDRNFVYYLIMLLISVWNIHHNAGFWHEKLNFFRGYAIWYNYEDLILTSCLGISYSMLTKSFLNTKNNLPFWNNLINVCIICLILFPLCTFLFPNRVVFQWISIFRLFASLFAFIVSSVSLYLNISASKYFLFANLFICLGTFVFLLTELNIIPANDFTINAYNIGLVLQALLFSIAFTKRFRNLSIDNELKQKEIIAHLEENEKVLIAWKDAVINSEKLQKESLSFQYESLKNQVNPHFLFNSLNVLVGLVYKNQDEAAKFVRELAQVYRYVLKNKDKELVSLETEVEFINAFIHLLKIRFANSLLIDVKLNDITNISIPPLTLQMLIENAIKHNTFSDKNPLRITIESEEGYIVVANNYQSKENKEEESGIGLVNLKNRFRFLTEKEILVIDGMGFFTVKVPEL